MTKKPRDLLHEDKLLALEVPSALCFYAIDVIKDRWLEAEPIIMRDPVWACEYAKTVIKGRWPEAEETILKDHRSMYLYARNVIKGRWPEAERVLIINSKDPIYNEEGEDLRIFYEMYVGFLRSIGKDLDIWESETEIWEE